MNKLRLLLIIILLLFTMDTVVGAYNVDIDGTWGIEIVVVDIYDKPK